MVGSGITQSKPSAFVRYRQKPNFLNGKDDGVRISVCLETVLALLYQHMDKYAFSIASMCRPMTCSSLQHTSIGHYVCSDRFNLGTRRYMK